MGAQVPTATEIRENRRKNNRVHDHDGRNTTRISVKPSAKKERAMWTMVKRLTRLPPREKAKIVVAQILPTLLNGAELHGTPWEGGKDC